MRQTIRLAPKQHSIGRESVPGSRHRLGTPFGHCQLESNSANHGRYLFAQARDGPCSSPLNPYIRETQFVDFPVTAHSKPTVVSDPECEPPAAGHQGEYFVARTAQIS